MPIDLKSQTPQGLRNLLDNSRRLGAAEMEQAVVREMRERGLATDTFMWNPGRVDRVMKPFARIAASVSNNQRVNYTKAGGQKIGLPKEHPQRLWIDCYSAIKTSAINAVFGCQIAKAGNDPKFTLYLGDESRREARPFKVYNADQLQQALADWEAIARSASPRA